MSGKRDNQNSIRILSPKTAPHPWGPGTPWVLGSSEPIPEEPLRRSARRVWVKPSQLDLQPWGPAQARTEDTAVNIVTFRGVVRLERRIIVFVHVKDGR